MSLDNPEFIGHENLGIEVERSRNFFLEQFKNDLGPNPSASSIIGPNVLIDKPTQLDLGDRIITLTPFPVSHSHSDLTIMDNRTSTLWAGDLIFRERIPSLTGSLIGWVKVMKELFNLKVELVIPGHGNVAESMTIAIKQQRDYLHRLLNETRNSIEEGQFINEAAENVDSENLSGWLLHDSQHPTNVSRAFNELEWE